LIHGERKVSLKDLARQIGVKSVQPCTPEVAQRHTGYPVGGISPFATRKNLPVYVQRSILEPPKIYINGAGRGFLVAIDPHVLISVLQATPVDCGLADEPSVLRAFRASATLGVVNPHAPCSPAETNPGVIHENEPPSFARRSLCACRVRRRFALRLAFRRQRRQ
jgi:hypothetical protein